MGNGITRRITQQARAVCAANWGKRGSGCDKCLPVCPVDCIYPDADWQFTTIPADWWDEPLGPNDPYR